MPDIRIVLADDHAVVRSGLRLLLDGEEGLEVVAEAGEIDTTKRMVRAHRPDVLVLDLNMPGGESLPAIPELAEHTAVVVLTMQNDPGFARQGRFRRCRSYQARRSRLSGLAARGGGVNMLPSNSEAAGIFQRGV